MHSLNKLKHMAMQVPYSLKEAQLKLNNQWLVQASNTSSNFRTK